MSNQRITTIQQVSSTDAHGNEARRHRGRQHLDYITGHVQKRSRSVPPTRTPSDTTPESRKMRGTASDQQPPPNDTIRDSSGNGIHHPSLDRRKNHPLDRDVTTAKRKTTYQNMIFNRCIYIFRRLSCEFLQWMWSRKTRVLWVISLPKLCSQYLQSSRETDERK